MINYGMPAFTASLKTEQRNLVRCGPTNSYFTALLLLRETLFVYFPCHYPFLIENIDVFVSQNNEIRYSLRMVSIDFSKYAFDVGICIGFFKIIGPPVIRASFLATNRERSTLARQVLSLQELGCQLAADYIKIKRFGASYAG
jgi:hypothetical protein